MPDFMDDIGMPAANTAQPQTEQAPNHNTQNYWASQSPASSQGSSINLTKGSESTPTQPSGYGTRPNDYGASATAPAQPSGYGTRPNDYGASATAPAQPSGYGTRPNDYGAASQTPTQPSGYGTRPNDYGAASQTPTQPSGYGTRPNDYGASTTPAQPSGYGTRPNDYGASATAPAQPSGYGTRPNNYGEPMQRNGYNNAAASINNGYGTRPNDYNDMYQQGSFDSSFAAAQSYTLMGVVLGTLGAIVGAIPGFLLMLILGKIGYFAVISGLVLAGGAFFGFSIGSSKENVPEKVCMIVCVIVCAIAVYLGVRICWCWEIIDEINKYLPELMDQAGAYANEEYSEIEIKKLAKKLFLEELGLRELSFSSVSAHFSTILDRIECKGKFVKDLLLSYLFAFVGGIGVFTKTK